jgi:hypothetical protein
MASVTIMRLQPHLEIGTMALLRSGVDKPERQHRAEGVDAGAAAISALRGAYAPATSWWFGSRLSVPSRPIFSELGAGSLELASKPDATVVVHGYQGPGPWNLLPQTADRNSPASPICSSCRLGKKAGTGAVESGLVDEEPAWRGSFDIGKWLQKEGSSVTLDVIPHFGPNVY